MNFSQHPLCNKWSACQLLEWDHYYEGHDGLWTSNWRKPRSKEPATEENSVVSMCIFPLFHLFLILTIWTRRAGLGHLCCACFHECCFCSCGPGADLFLGGSVWQAVSTLCVCECTCVYMCVNMCVCMESSFLKLLLGGPGDTKLKQLPICRAEEASLALRDHQDQ